MLELDQLIVFIGGCIIIIIAPGPDILLAISRGLAQGRAAAVASSLGCGCSIFVHSALAAFGLSLILKTSIIAFTIVKYAGAMYLIYLGYRCIRAKELSLIRAADPTPITSILLTGFLSNFLNPKVLLFTLAFLPQFINFAKGSAATQMLALGTLFAVMTTLSFCVIGSFASSLSSWLLSRPRFVSGLNIGAGFSLILSGLRIATMKHQST